MNANSIDTLIRQAVFGTDAEKQAARREIRAKAADAGLYPASIHDLYMAAGKGAYRDQTVPAINVRGITYDVSRAVYRAILKNDARACIFELARSEMGYTLQTPDEYVVAVLAAGLREGYRGPVFIQADHTQVNTKKYAADAASEMTAIKNLVGDAVEAGFYNIDIDASTLVELDKGSLEEEQDKNSSVTAEMTKFIRGIEPQGVTVSIGGEIGEIGRGNSTVADLDAFMKVYRSYLGEGVEGISKVSVQTGTTHGGVVMPDGSLAKVKIDFETLREMGQVARDKYGLGGAVQHGASTLPDEAFGMFPDVGTLEVHLATGFQNIIYDSAAFPKELMAAIEKQILAAYQHERKEGDSDEQLIYKTRKKSFGDFKKELWDLPPAANQAIMQELEDRFDMMFKSLNVTGTGDLIKKYIA
jgi:fructose/tagatose bisphosphate aldolase